MRELGITSCLGVLLMIITNKVFLPLLLSYTRLEPAVLAASLPARRAGRSQSPWDKFACFARPGPARGGNRRVQLPCLR
ncbi:hypothetical protein ACU4GD_05585 [Cupriavidus basilensis]